MEKYNPTGNDLTIGRAISSKSYHDGIFLANDENGVGKICDVLQNGGHGEIRAQRILDTGVQYVILKIYFVPLIHKAVHEPLSSC